MNELIAIRRQLHQMPEIAFCEVQTARFLADYLKKLNIEVTEGIAKTGIVGLIHGKQPGKTLLLRADMDALPVEEATGFPFASKNSGMMHACGHDIHMTVLLGAAKRLAETRDEWSGTVKIVFQPAEEGAGGAQPMIEEGVLTNPNVDGAFAFHVWPMVETGKIELKYGSVLASPDHFIITVTGKGGHGAMPEDCINPLVPAAEIALELTRLTDRTAPCVVSVCSIDGGTNTNVIPDYVLVKGTARALTREKRQEIYDQIRSISERLCKAHGASAELEYHFLYPPLINNDQMVDLAKETANQVVGGTNVIISETPDMIGEDFSYFAENVPSVWVKLGCTKAGNTPTPLHSSNFNADEDCIQIGIKMMESFARNFLK